MSGRLAVDFGTSNTLVAVWDAARREGVPLHIPDYGLISRQGEDTLPIIPSLIHYTPDKRRWIGAQVLQQGLYGSPTTFRWMKRYIAQRSPLKLRLDGREISPFEAGQDFLASVLVFAGREVGLQDEEVVFSAPVEAYEHYENWLAGVATAAGMPRFRLIDEPSAAALGYGTHIQPGHVYLIFDFGGGTMHAAVVLVEDDAAALSGRRCRVLGKAGRDLGGSTIDQWLFEATLRQNHRQDSEEAIRRISNALLVECERVKEALSFNEQADLSVMDPDSGAVLAATFTRAQFEDLLDQRGCLADINRTVRTALNTARERGYDEDSIQSVLLVGGSSQIPAVQRALRQIFGPERVHANRPLDAIVRGAAAFAAGVDFYDHIQHDYAIRYINPQSGEYEYRTIVHRGTPYPTPEALTRLVIKASHAGQKQLGLAIFEIGSARPARSSPIELVFDPGGAARLLPVSAAEEERRTYFWMNEHSPTFLAADPPAVAGEERFQVEFRIDGNKRLTITVRDLKSGLLTHQNFPVVRLT
ncbi:MAG TPA: Hsp70 family protein [Anaerolineaceae bacterium]|nr:Hsp70 family protein [Anaerolineaceae bacterium]